MPARPPKVALMTTPDETEAQFYEALQRGDLDRVMAVWADDDDIACIHPSGPRLLGLHAIRAGRPIVTDVEMIIAGLSSPRLAHFGVTTHHFISDADVIAAAQAQQTTRAVQAMRKAHAAGLIDGGIIAVGNAPTALLEVLRLIREEAVRPALIIGMPVGFVSAAESKAELAELADIPWIIIHGRKGGSPLVVAAIHALLALASATIP